MDKNEINAFVAVTFVVCFCCGEIRVSSLSWRPTSSSGVVLSDDDDVKVTDVDEGSISETGLE